MSRARVGTGAGDHAQHDVITDAQFPAEPVVLGEVLGFGADDDVGPVALQVDPPVRAELGDTVERRGGEVDDNSKKRVAAVLI